MGINVSSANKNFKDALANYKLAAYQLADELLKLRKDITAWQTCIESNLDLIEKTESGMKKADLQAEIDNFLVKISDRQEAYAKTAAELEKRITPFYELTQKLYADYLSMRGTADVNAYKKAVKAFLDGQGVKYDDKSIMLIVTAVGVRSKSARALYKDSTTMTSAETKKKFRDVIARTLCDLCGDQLPVYKWTYKPAKTK